MSKYVIPAASDRSRYNNSDYLSQGPLQKHIKQQTNIGGSTKFNGTATVKMRVLAIDYN